MTKNTYVLRMFNKANAAVSGVIISAESDLIAGNIARSNLFQSHHGRICRTEVWRDDSRIQTLIIRKIEGGWEIHTSEGELTTHQYLLRNNRPERKKRSAA